MDYIFVEGNKRDDSTLMKGDLLEKTEFLERVLEKEYVGTNKLLLDSEYFVVLTQSCDLVRLKKNPKSPFITIASVQHLESALNDHTSKIKDQNIDSQLNICNLSYRTQTLQYLERLLNNSEKSHYCLPVECHSNFSKDYCIVLNLSVAISSEYYNRCLEAKIGQMEEIFAAKLGWMAGNQFSRVATPDIDELIDNTKGGSSFKSVFMERVFSSATIWLSTHQIKELKKLIKHSKVSSPISTITLMDLANKVPSNYSLAINRVFELLSNEKIIDEVQSDKVKKALYVDKNLRNLVINTVE